MICNTRSDTLVHVCIDHVGYDCVQYMWVLTWITGAWKKEWMKEWRKEMFYLMTHWTHFIYGYMASDIWYFIYSYMASDIW